MAGLYFEEFNVGQKIMTGHRTVTDEDITTFADLTGDNNRIHLDAEFSRAGPFGQRIAHGLLGLSIASGLAWRTGILDGTVIAFREVIEWKFIKPVFIGDILCAELNVTGAKALPRIGAGSVIITVELKNQKNETCMKGNWNMLIMSKPK
jgi:3-hydroxybutyryl-CoA dehydratase